MDWRSVGVMNSVHPFWVGGKPISSDTIAEVNFPGDGSVVGSHYVPTAQHVEQAIDLAAKASAEFRGTPVALRAEALMHVSAQLAHRLDEVAGLIVAENGKPLMWARAEASRAVNTFRWAAEEARRFSGELQRLDTEVAVAGRMALIRRFPRGPVLGISPFNFPLNLVAHKIAPALAVGAPIVLKPAPATPLSALLLGEILAEVDLPVGSWSILPVGNDLAATMVKDERLPVISFTGSDVVGYSIQREVPHKHLTLELGGNAAAIVLDDWNSDQDLEWAATRIATFANYQAGQSCVSVQRVLIHQSLWERLSALIVDKTKQLSTGDVHDPSTVVGPMINEAAAVRVEAWVNQAVTSGATLLCGGSREGSTYAPTVLTNVSPDQPVVCNEVFGPVVVLSQFATFNEAIAQVNDSKFGLQTGVFTHNVQSAFHAHRELEVGGVIIGDVPSFRSDQMPYGGTKASGMGKEGLRFAMEDFTYERVMVLSGLDL